MILVNDDTTRWSMAGLLIALILASELWAQAIFIILFPTLGWTLLYFIKREIVYRFPPKVPKTLSSDVIL